ncbi:MAG: phosphatidylserine decarboxylase family protein [Schleiferiaceae bacterium]|nr:phosphatidylserine decarboxylase family protein [Schleiferiaceae bacterium]
MTIHKEGKGTLTVSFVALFIMNALVQYLTDLQWLHIATLAISVVLYAVVLQFFRNPKRTVTLNPDAIICPADGKVVTIEEVFEDEILKDKRIQVSIFMSPFNVHVNRYPLGGKVVDAIHHQGKFLVAWHPKSSTLNERTTVTLENDRWGKVLFRQIAGAVARRIVMYSKPGDLALQGSEYGFIKFGSRVDLFLPLDSKILVKEGQVVKGGITELAKRP